MRAQKYFRKNKDLEHLEQCQVIEWVRLQILAGNWAEELDLLHAIPNGGKRDIVTAAKLKNEGVRKGVPDLSLPVARGGFSGLYLEMKIKGGTVSPEQRNFMQGVVKQGFHAVVCWDAPEAIRTLQDYLEGKLQRCESLNP